MIGFKIKGNFKKTEDFLKNANSKSVIKVLNQYGQEGVKALSEATPVDTGLTANSWYFKLEMGNGYSKILFCNSNIQNGVPIAIILQYGHATRNGGWVEGRDYINPALEPVFNKLAKSAWKEVTKL